MRRLPQTTLADATLERVRQEHAAAIVELQRLPSSAIRVVQDVTLESDKETPIAHGLGRPPVWVRESCPRSATATALASTGRVVEVRTDGDRSKYVVLKATGWGASIVVDVMAL